MSHCNAAEDNSAIKRIKRTAQIATLLAFSMVLIPAIAYSDSKTIELATGTDYAPYVSPDLPEGGVVSEVVSRVFEEMGYQRNIMFVPWKRAYKRVLETESDATFPYAWSEERADLFFYSRPINKVTVRVFQNQERTFKFNSVEDLNGLSYCQPLGYQTEPKLSAMMDEGVLIREEANDMDGCFRMLAAKRVNFVVSNDLVAWEAIVRVLGSDADDLIHAVDIPFREISEHLIISKNHPMGENLIREFNEAYDSLLSAGVLTKIWTNRLGEHASAVK